MTSQLVLNSARPLIFLGLAVSLFACTPDKGYHPGVNVPENHAIVHKPKYIIKATIEEGEMEEKTGDGVEIAQGEPPKIPPLHPWAEPTMDSVPTNIEIDPGLAEACKIPDAKAFFGTDSAEIQPEAQAALDALAECFKTGPMKGHKLSITGHADPRGSEEDNTQLGWDRAAAVAGHLAGAGLEPHEMAQDSAGESEASEDPEQWPYDRKVVLDIHVDGEGEGEGGEAAPEGDAPADDAAAE